MKAAWVDVTGLVHEVVLPDQNDAAVPGGTFFFRSISRIIFLQ